MSKRFLAIVDPWKECMPHDIEKYPHLQSDVNFQCQLIHNQLTRLKPLFDDIIVMSSGFETNPLFAELYTIRGLGKSKYLEDKQDWDAWLCGFHYGRCIHLKINEVVGKNGWDYSPFHIIQNLSFMFPGDTKNRIIGGYRTKDAVLNTKEYYWDYVGSLSEL